MLRSTWIHLGLAVMGCLAPDMAPGRETPRGPYAPWGWDQVPSMRSWSRRVEATRIPDYTPASRTASVYERQGSWQSLHVRGLDADGYAVVGIQHLKPTLQSCYYESAGAEDAYEFCRQAQNLHSHGVAWMVASPIVGAFLGCYVGGYLGYTRPVYATGSDWWGSRADEERAGNIFEGAVIGEVAGLVAGFGTGMAVAGLNRQRSRDLREQAAESFNQKLLRDVNLRAPPRPGGGTLELQKRF